MKSALLPISLLLMLSSYTSQATAVTSPSAAPKRQSPQDAGKAKSDTLLERAWSLRKQNISKKLAFIENIQKELNQQKQPAGMRSRLQLAMALVLVTEEETRWAAVDLIQQSAQAEALQISKNAVGQIWKEFKVQMQGESNLERRALASVALALSTAGAGAPDDAFSYSFSVALINQGKKKEALAALEKIDPSSKFYRSAKLQEGLLFAELGQTDKAKAALDIVMLLEETEAERAVSDHEKKMIDAKERAVLNLARLSFEKGEFKDALSLYRSIDTESPLFYESLREQGWAFFMAGHPNRALGAVHGATSPHFNQQFQPDQYFLQAAVNYWLCDFPAARRGLQAFVAHTSSEAQMLKQWQESSSTANENAPEEDLEKAFKVVEGLSQGVTHSNNLLGPRSLQSLGRRKSIIEGLADLEKLRSARKNILSFSWPLQSKNMLMESFLRLEKEEKDNVAKIALSQIRTMSREYERTLAQMRLIHIEVMTAEKDKLTQSDRSSQGQEYVGMEKDFLENGGSQVRIWEDKKREFWKDELDSFVFAKRSQCDSTQGGGTKNESM